MRFSTIVAAVAVTLFSSSEADANIRIGNKSHQHHSRNHSLSRHHESVRQPETTLSKSNIFGSRSLDSEDRWRLASLSSAWQRHLTGPKPPGWQETVQSLLKVSEVEQLQGADYYCNTTLKYQDRTDPPGKWIRTPYESWKQQALCRDIAACKIDMLTEVKYDTEKLRLLRIAPGGSSGNPHVIVAAKTSDGAEYIMEMLGRHIALERAAKHGILIPLNGPDKLGTTNRQLTASYSPADWKGTIQNTDVQVTELPPNK